MPDQIVSILDNNSTNSAHIYRDAMLSEAHRVLSLLDRERFSPTFGCFDRTYWAWKFTDFPGARFQEGLCVLSFLYASPFEGNPFYQSSRLLDWITGGFDFWTKIQYPDGSFDEAYPFERSLAATAFTSFYLSEALNFLDGNLATDTENRFRIALERAGGWLVRNDEKHGFLSNHLAAAAAALYHIYRICGQTRFQRRSDYFLERILDHQSSEGWYDEYGGADPGYQTHGSFYLARLLDLSDNNDIADSLEYSFQFLAHFIHADGSIGGEYGSRNTQTYYPAAFEMLSGRSGKAHWIAATMLSSVEDFSAAGLGTVDIYNLFPLMNNYVFAYLACKKQNHRTKPMILPKDDHSTIHFPQAGIFKIRNSKYELYIGLSKGGVVKAFSMEDKRLCLNDCGYIGRLKSGKMISSQSFDRCRHIRFNNDHVVIEGKFSEFTRPVLSPFTFVGFRAFTLTFGRFRKFSYLLKTLLVKVLIHRRHELDLKYRRRISWQSDAFAIEDWLQGTIGDKIDHLRREDLFTTIHMGSSRYFLPNEIISPLLSDEAVERNLDLSSLNQGVNLKRKVRF
ncbi:MAG: hypothetical protein SWQ30_16200 [Thermodesulfobacteriota bacterium]|nr:hypothetical protein [Thermodesulfobacteriota bacterium]